MAQLKVQAGFNLAAGGSHPRNRIPTPHNIAYLLEGALVIGIDTQVIATMNNNQQITKTGHPAGKNHSAWGYRAHRGAGLCSQHNTAPNAAIRTFSPELALHFAAYRIRQATFQTLETTFWFQGGSRCLLNGLLNDLNLAHFGNGRFADRLARLGRGFQAV